jgi:hypothetical protein
VKDTRRVLHGELGLLSLRITRLILRLDCLFDCVLQVLLVDVTLDTFGVTSNFMNIAFRLFLTGEKMWYIENVMFLFQYAF